MPALRHAFRSLLRSPGFTLTALLTLALGIGVNTSMFTVVNTLLLQPVPFAAPDQLVRIYRTGPQSDHWPHAVANFLDLKAQSHAFAGMAGYVNSSTNYTAPGQPAERLSSMSVTADFFSVLGIPPALGRTFTADEVRPNAPVVVVLSHEFWQSRFAADPTIVGRTLRIDGTTAIVIGVMPDGFVPPMLWGSIDLWRPLAFTAEQERNYRNSFLSVVARLAPATSLARAQAELSGIASRLAADHPDTNANTSDRLVSLARSNDNTASSYASWFVLGLAGFVLLIACANLANLQISRAAGRSREHAIRLALGASCWRVARGLLSESLLLRVAGGALGFLLAVWCNDFFGRQLVLGPSAGVDLPVDFRVIGFALAVSTVAVFASGLLPAWIAARANVSDALKIGSRGVVAGHAQHRLRHALIVGEVALALTLLAGAGMFIRGLQRLNNGDPGWHTDNLLTGVVNLPAGKYPDEASQRAFFQKLDAALAASPLIEQAAISSAIPTHYYGTSTHYAAIEGRTPFQPGAAPLAKLVFVSRSFFDTLGVRRLRGRLFAASDLPGHPHVVVINESMARALFPRENPVGHRISHADPTGPTWFEIVGVVSDVAAPGELTPADTRFQTYRPLTQETYPFATVTLRGRVPAKQLAGELRRIVASIDPDQPIANIVTARGRIARSLANVTAIGRLLAGFALLGLVLAAIGIYGMLANFVLQRTQEIGVRLALGAQLRDILQLVLGRGLRLSLLGAAFGLGGAFAVTRVLGRLLPGLGHPQPLTLAGIVLTLLAVAALACWLPARRATKVDPITALRTE
jgi:predicted permease